MSAIGPVSNPGRTMMASLQQAISKGMPPDQAIAYVKSMAMAGLAPLADLYSMMKQFERLKQPTALPPQGGTIKDQLNQAMAQKQMAQQGQMQDPRMAQQMPQQSQMPQDTQQGLPAIQAARGGLMYASPMERGLGGLDAGSMNDAQYAAGGIVAFADGSPAGVVDVNRWTQKDADRYKELTDFRNKVAPQSMPIGGGFGVIGTPYFPDEGAARLFDQTDDEYNILKQKREDALLRQTNATKKQDLANQISDAASKYKIPLSPEPPAITAAPAVQPVVVDDVTRLQQLLGNSGRTPPTGSDRSVRQPAVSNYLANMRATLAKLETDKPTSARGEANRIKDDLANLGIGNAAKDERTRLEERGKEVKSQQAQDRQNTLAEAGFAMAEAAGRRGRDRVGFLGAAGVGGQTYVKGIKQIEKEKRALKDSLAQQMYNLKLGEEQQLAGNYEKGTAMVQRAKDKIDEARVKLNDAERGGYEFGITSGLQERQIAATLQAARDKLTADPIDNLKTRLSQVSELIAQEKDPRNIALLTKEKDRILEIFKSLALSINARPDSSGFPPPVPKEGFSDEEVPK